MPRTARTESRKPLEIAAEVVAKPRKVTWEILSERLNDIVVLADPSSVIFYVSPACARLGYAPHDLIGRGPADLVHPDDLARFMANTVAVFGSGEPVGAELREYRCRRKDGGWVWLQGSPSLIHNDDGETIGFANVFRDVTERRAAQDALTEALAAAEKLAAVKSEFLANMSHEIRTPLTAVLGFTNLLAQRDDLAEEARRHVERVAAAGRSLLAIVNDVLDFSKLEAGRVSLAPKPTDIVGLAREALELFERGAADKGLTLRFETAGPFPETVAMDPDRVRQIVVNLVGNAVKFTDRGGVSLRLDYESEGQRAVVAVTDTGPGIPAAARERLFQRFTQADSSPTRAKGGTGLGLAISRALAEAMGGSVTVTSRLGRGSTFRLELPAPPAQAIPESDGGGAGLELLDGLRVLIVDDNPVNRELGRAILEPMGVTVSEAPDGLQAIAAAAQAPFDLILMDLRMPRMDGAQAAAAIRREAGPNRDAPILSFSADSEANAAGPLGPFNGRVAKPVTPHALLLAVIAAVSGEGEAPEALAL